MVDPISPQEMLTRIVSFNGRQFAPQGMLVEHPATVQDWVETVRTVILPKAKKAEKYGQGKRGRILIPDWDLHLHFASKGGHLWWYLIDDRAPAGAGRLTHFKEEEIFYGCDYAAFFKDKLRGRRLYEKVLRSLAYATSTPIESSRRLKSAAALRCWKRMGVFWPSRKRFKLTNPCKPIPWYPPFCGEDLGAFFTSMST